MSRPAAAPRAALRAHALRVPALAPTLFAGALLLPLAAACNGPRVIHERPILVTGQRVPTADGARAGAGAAADQQAAAAAAEASMADALAGCRGEACDALARGEVALGMTEAQVIAATRSAPSAWTVRRGAGGATMTPAAASAAPSDVTGEVVMVQLADGRARAVSYREPQGIRTVTRAEDATPEGRGRATAQALIREGDAFNAAGDRAAALDRYDRALVLLPNDALLQYRVATLLDLQLRPVEALIRYQRFLTSQEVALIDARGNANAKLGEAIARAQQRILVLERQR
jgi:tetratricopeptide (TPR) repeat protein